MPEDEGVSGEKSALKLQSPVGAEAIQYGWPLAKTKQYDAAGEILETMGWVCREWPELKIVMESVVKYKAVERSNYDEMKSLCDKFNAAVAHISKMHKGFTRPDRPEGNVASTALLKHIIQQCYNRAVANPENLNHHYDAWTPETYGETTFEMVQRIIEEVKPRGKDVIVDLGSGVGQVVLQFASANVRKVVGIEKAKVPADYAKTMEAEFRRWMKWYGKKHKPFELIHSDFMHPKFRAIIKEASVIFVNNYAFGPDLDEQLKQMFADEIADGVRIISSKSFCAPRTGRLNQRHMTDLSAIMEVTQLPPVPNPVSWTCKNVTFYLHIKDSRRLEEYYFTTSRNRADSSSKSSSRASSRENSVAPKVAKDNEIAISPKQSGGSWVVGTTTRRQYQVWVDSKDKTGSSKSSGGKKMVVRNRSFSNASSATSSEPGESSAGSAQSKIVPEVTSDSSKTKPGRPRKCGDKSSRKGTFRESLELLHHHTLLSNMRDPDTNDELDVHVSHLSANNQLQSFKPSKYPQLDVFLEQMRGNYEKMLDEMQTGDFREIVLANIDKEKERCDALTVKKDALTRQVTMLQEEGVKLIKLRMNELGMTAETSADLLNQAKDVVMKQKQLQTERHLLKAEVAQLEQTNDQLQALCRVKDEHTIKSGVAQAMGVPPQLTSPDSVKQFLLREIGQQLTHRRQVKATYTQLQQEVYLLQEVPFDNINGHAKLKRPRQKSPRSTSGPRSKKVAGVAVGATKSATEQSTGDPLKQEEIERQIQDIVQKALSVDSAAKTAEKERKQKSLERKKAQRSAAPVALNKCTGKPVNNNNKCTDSDPTLTSSSLSTSNDTLATFSSPGLVPVFPLNTLPKCEPPSGADMLPQPQRTASVSTSDTESAPSEPTTGDVDVKPPNPSSVIVLRQGESRPSSLPPCAPSFSIAQLVGNGPRSSISYPRVQSAQPFVFK